MFLINFLNQINQVEVAFLSDSFIKVAFLSDSFIKVIKQKYFHILEDD